MLKKRIIPCLDIKNGRTVKGINFVNLRDALSIEGQMLEVQGIAHVQIKICLLGGENFKMLKA